MPAAPPGAIASETAHLWFLDTATFDEPYSARQWLARLEEHERLRYTAFRAGSERREYLATRALARTALAHYTGERAESLRFETDRRGRPELISPATPDLCFSLANTKQLAVGLFAFEREVGVDVELVAPIEALELAERFFSARELAELSRLEDNARLTRFYELWTLREAYLKARGLGLTLALEELAFEPSPAGSVQAEFGPAIGDDPAGWQFGLTWLSDRHLAATCIRRTSPEMSTRIVPFDASALLGAPAPQSFD